MQGDTWRAAGYYKKVKDAKAERSAELKAASKAFEKFLPPATPWVQRGLSNTPSAYEAEDTGQSLVLGSGKIHYRPAGRDATWKVCHDFDLGPLRLHEIDDTALHYWTRVADEKLAQILIWQATGLYVPTASEAEQEATPLIEWGCALLKRFPVCSDYAPEEYEDTSGQYQCDWIDQQLLDLLPRDEFLDLLDDWLFEVCQMSWPDGFQGVVFAPEAADRQHADELMWQVFEKTEEMGFTLLEDFGELDDPHNYFIDCFSASIRAWRDAVGRHFERSLKKANKKPERKGTTLPKPHQPMPDLERALQIAVQSHAGQKDKSGAPYIFHPIRVMMRCTSPNAKIVALLHDVVEDTPTTFEDLEAAGFSPEVLATLRLVTHADDTPYDEYIGRLMADPVAIEVKIADLEDNSDIRRLSEIDDRTVERLRKYLRAHKKLTAMRDSTPPPVSSRAKSPPQFPPAWPFKRSDFPPDAEFINSEGAPFVRLPSSGPTLVNFFDGKAEIIPMTELKCDNHSFMSFEDWSAFVERCAASYKDWLASKAAS